MLSGSDGSASYLNCSADLEEAHFSLISDLNIFENLKEGLDNWADISETFSETFPNKFLYNITVRLKVTLLGVNNQFIQYKAFKLLFLVVDPKKGYVR